MQSMDGSFLVIKLIQFPILLGIALWVYFDQKAICGDLAKEPGTVEGGTPLMWALGCLLFGYIVFPFYLYRRPELKRRVALYRDLPTDLKWDNTEKPEQWSPEDVERKRRELEKRS